MIVPEGRIRIPLLPGMTLLLHLAAAAASAAPDTLRNHARDEPLVLLRYGREDAGGAGPGKGLLLGHNSHYRQGFAEKYALPGGGTVTGLIAHLGGTAAHGDHRAEFAIYDVAPDGLPGRKLAARTAAYGDLPLSGAPAAVRFPAGAAVGDSFFSVLDLGDYAHGGYEGDTLGLYACRAGCRSEADLGLFGRNAIRWHGHGEEDWHDFYYQNFTPLPIHLALYPVVERAGPAGLETRAGRAAVGLRLVGGPTRVEIRFHLPGEDLVRIRLTDASGRRLGAGVTWRLPPGASTRELDPGTGFRGVALLRLDGRHLREDRRIFVP